MEPRTRPGTTERLTAGAVCLLVATTLLGGLTPFGAATTPDAARYIEVAQNIREGRGIVIADEASETGYAPFTTYPPLYPSLLSLFAGPDVGGERAAARMALVTLFCSAFLFFELLYPAVGYAGALLGALIFSVSPPVLTVFTYAWSESLTLALLLAAIGCGLRCVETASRGSTRRHALLLAALALACAALAYCRYIGVLFAVLVPLVWLVSGRVRTTLHAVAAGAVALLCGALYLRNYLLLGYFSGALREASSKGPVDNLFDLADAFYTQLAPDLRALVVVGVVTLALLALRASRGVAGPPAAARGPFDYPSTLRKLAWGCCLTYTLGLVVLRSLKELDVIDTRFIAPAFALLLLVLVAEAGTRWRGSLRPLRATAVFAVSVFVLGLVTARGLAVQRDSANGWATDAQPRFPLSSFGEYYNYTLPENDERKIAALESSARSLLADGEQGTAVETMQSALAQSGATRYRVAKELATIYAGQGDVASAIAQTRECLRLDPSQAEVDIAEIVAPLYKTQRYDRALEYYDMLLEDLPQVWWVHHSIGTLARTLGDTELARESLATSERLKKRRPVVLIVVDTLRADALGLYGNDRPTSPSVDAWAARARVFERVYATASWTLPSFGSIYTGQLPMRHGAGLVKQQGAELVWDMLDPTVPTLAQMLERRGYATCAIVNNPYLGPAFGTLRGFRAFDYDPGTEERTRRADVVVDRALDWLDDWGGVPFLQVVHLFDPHMPYDAPAPFRGKFTAAYDSRYSLPVSQLEEIKDGVAGLSDEDRAFIRAAYDEEVAFTDHHVGRFLDGLDKRGILDRAVVILTADHGEEFFEHGGFEHGHALWDELLRVPLLVWGPGVRPGRETAPVSIVDLAPTVLEALGLPVPPGLAGVSLWPNLTGGSPIGARMMFAEGNLYGPQDYVAIRWPDKAHLGPETRPFHLFDLAADPGERSDLLRLRPALAGELSRETSARVAAAGEARAGRTGREARPDAATLERLRALGYVD